MSLLCDQPEAVRDVPGTHPRRDLSVLCGSSDCAVSRPMGEGRPGCGRLTVECAVDPGTPIPQKGSGFAGRGHRSYASPPTPHSAGTPRPCSKVSLLPDSPASHLIFMVGDSLGYCRVLAAFRSSSPRTARLGDWTCLQMLPNAPWVQGFLLSSLFSQHPAS